MTSVNNSFVKLFCGAPLRVQQNTATKPSANVEFAPVNQVSPSAANIISFRGISFSGTIPTTFSLSNELKEDLSTESTKRIEGQYPWPEIKNTKGWMVSCETQTFMKTGGLGEVATQLSDAYNLQKGKGAMTIVTPLYVGNDIKGKKHPEILEERPDGLRYKGAEGKVIELKRIGELPIRVFEAGKFKTQKAEILTGELNGTRHIFFRNDKYFDVTRNASTHPACQGPYVNNKFNINETQRMAYFSKAVYEYMLKTKTDETFSADRPNILVANDWHASSISALMRYLAPIKHERDKGSSAKNVMTDGLYDFIRSVPIVHITHNAMYQGREKDGKRANSIYKTLFGNDAQNVKDYAKGFGAVGPALHHGKDEGSYNCSYADLHLADRIVAVSPNYTKEMCSVPELACGQQEVNQTRKEYNTILGIVNGYDKNLAEPNAAFVEDLNTAFKDFLDNKKFTAFDGMYNIQGYEEKMKNKAVFAYVLSAVAQGKEFAGVNLYKPEECEIPENIENIPILTSVGRFAEQKGYDYLAEALKEIYTQKGSEKPVLVMLGSGDKDTSDNLHKFKDDVAKVDPKAARRIFIFDGFSKQLAKAIRVGGDFMLIPSKWEPCGLTQMEAMAGGNLPIALATGGLVDTIENGENGFVSDAFYGYKDNKLVYGEKTPGVENNVEAFAAALKSALDTYCNDPEKIKKMSINAMTKDFSWASENGPLEKYDELFRTGKVAS